MNFTEENKLEELLRLAAHEPAHRPEFYRVLLNSTIFIIGTSEDHYGGSDKATLPAGSKINIRNWEREDGTHVIPFFSSLETLQNSIDRELTYIELPVRSLFEMTLGSTLLLNPRSYYGKEFLPEEVKQLLSSGSCQELRQRTPEKKNRVLLGQPNQYPSKMVDSLIQLLSKHKNVNRAFLALMHDISKDARPHLLIGIEAEGDIEPVFKEAGSVAGDTTPEGEPVDLYRISGGDCAISRYLMNETEPFYDRRWGSKLRSLFWRGTA